MKLLRTVVVFSSRDQLSGSGKTLTEQISA